MSSYLQRYCQEFLYSNSEGFSIVRTRTFYGYSSQVYKLPRCGYHHACNQERMMHMNSSEKPRLSGDKTAEEQDAHHSLKARLTRSLKHTLRKGSGKALNLSPTTRASPS